MTGDVLLMWLFVPKFHIMFIAERLKYGFKKFPSLPSLAAPRKTLTVAELFLRVYCR